MELAAATHLSSPKGGWPGVTHDALRGQTTACSGGRRPGVLKEPEPPNVVEKVQRHILEQTVSAPGLQILDAPVPQTVDQLVTALSHVDSFVPEQVDRSAQDLVLARLSGSRRRRNCWWKCRLSCPGLCSFQFRVVVVGSVFKVLSQYRVQQRIPLSSSLTFLLVEVFKVYAQAKVQQRFLEVRRSGPPRRSLTFQFLLVFLAVFKVFLRFMMQIIVFGVVKAIVMAFTMLNRVPHRAVELIITMITELTSLLGRLSCHQLVARGLHRVPLSSVHARFRRRLLLLAVVQRAL